VLHQDVHLCNRVPQSREGGSYSFNTLCYVLPGRCRLLGEREWRPARNSRIRHHCRETQDAPYSALMRVSPVRVDN
jgi:hypothetical protein